MERRGCPLKPKSFAAEPSCEVELGQQPERRLAWWHIHLCRRSRHYREQPGARHSQAERQCANRRLSEAEYRILGQMLRDAARQEKYITTVDIIRQIALTGCRRSEMIQLKWSEVDSEASCLRLMTARKENRFAPSACRSSSISIAGAWGPSALMFFPGKVKTMRPAVSQITGNRSSEVAACRI